MTTDVQSDFVTTLQHTLELMAFVIAEPMPADAVSVPPDPILVRMGFTAGDLSGSVELVAGLGFGIELAANLLGCAPDDPDAQERGVDSLQELVNVVVGATMPALATPADAAVKLALPMHQPFDAKQWDAWLTHPMASAFDADGHVIAARLIVSDPRGVLRPQE